MNRKMILGLVALGMAALLLATGACTPEPGSGGSGSLRVVVADKPYPVDIIQSAIVTLTKVEVRKADTTDSQTTSAQSAPDATAEDTESGDGSNSAFVTIFQDAAGKSFDLLTLRNGRTDLLGDADIPAGTYTQMRLIVAGGQVTLTDGRTFPLKVPSGEESGIKLNFTFEVKEGQKTDLLLDVDLSKAFTPIPGGHIDDPSKITSFHFSPSVAMRLINLVQAGSISGIVTDTTAKPIGGVLVTAYQDTTEVTSTSTDPDGKYTLVGLTTGTYRLVFSATGYTDAEVTNIAVEAGKTTPDVNATLTATQ